MHQFLSDMVDFYIQTREEAVVDVVLTTTRDAENPVMVAALENSLGQVLRNLIDNALTFSPDSEIDSKTGSETASVRLAYERGENDAQGLAIVTIDDDGVGIPKDDLEAIFRRFYTQRPKGTAFGNHSGLGLAICRQIMDAHGGSVTASNRTDAAGKITGARFILELPLQIVEKDKVKSKVKSVSA